MCDLVVVRATANLPQTTTEDLFEAVGGSVLVTVLFGLVTTAIQNQSTTGLLQAGTANSIWNANLQSAPVGTIIGNEIQSGNSATDKAGAVPRSFVLAAGATVHLETNASSTGQIKWVALWRPLDEGATLVVS